MERMRRYFWVRKRTAAYSSMKIGTRLNKLFMAKYFPAAAQWFVRSRSCCTQPAVSCRNKIGRLQQVKHQNEQSIKELEETKRSHERTIRELTDTKNRHEESIKGLNIIKQRLEGELAELK